jgi:serine/threonine protein kinase
VIGSDFGHYRIDRKLDEGGFGTVYAATNTLIQREVAIKVLHDHLHSEHSTILRFRREAQSAAALRHKGIVEVLDFVESSGHFGIVMELVNGVSLDEYISAHRSLGLAEKIKIVADMAEALQAAHDAGIIHRDIKPGNILIDDEGMPRLTDFGLAKLQDDGMGSAITASGSILGTPAYMSPEHSAGKPGGTSSDVYSLGIVLYELIAGKLPFHSETPQGYLQEHIHAEAQPVRLLNPQTPKNLDNLVAKCLAKDPERRPASMGELASALREIDLPAQDNGIHKAVTLVEKPGAILKAKNSLASGHRRNGRVVRTVAIVCVIAALIVAFVWIDRPEGPANTPVEELVRVIVEVEGVKQSGLFHYLAPDGVSALISFENGNTSFVPIENVTFDAEDRR